MGGLLKSVICIDYTDQVVGQTINQFKNSLANKIKNIIQTNTDVGSRIIYMILPSSQEVISHWSESNYVIQAGNSMSLMITCTATSGYAHLEFTSYTSDNNNLHARMSNWIIS